MIRPVAFLVCTATAIRYKRHRKNVYTVYVSYSGSACLLSMGVVLGWMPHLVGHASFGDPRRLDTEKYSV